MNNCFTQTVCEICGLETATLAKGYKYAVYNGAAVTVEGHKGIVVYDVKCVCFALRKGRLSIKGEGLSVKALERDFAVVTGAIQSVAVDNA